MNNQFDTLSLISEYSSKVVNYATEIIVEGNQKEIDRLFKYYPELLYHQYVAGIWYDFAWNLIYEIDNENDNFTKDLFVSRLNKLKEMNYIPSGMFRERLVSQSIENPFMLEEYINLFEKDTTKTYKDINNNNYGSLLSLFICFADNCNFETYKENYKNLISLLVKNSTKTINEKERCGNVVVEELLSNSVFIHYPIMIFRLIDKGMNLKLNIESRNRFAVEYFKNNGMANKIKKHSYFCDHDCVELPLIQSLLFDYGSDNKNYIQYSDKKKQILNEVMKRLRKEYPELEKENQKILNDLNISALNDIYY